jgi:hypothetical protein
MSKNCYIKNSIFIKSYVYSFCVFEEIL